MDTCRSERGGCSTSPSVMGQPVRGQSLFRQHQPALAIALSSKARGQPAESRSRGARTILCQGTGAFPCLTRMASVVIEWTATNAAHKAEGKEPNNLPRQVPGSASRVYTWDEIVGVEAVGPLHFPSCQALWSEALPESLSRVYTWDEVSDGRAPPNPTAVRKPISRVHTARGF